MREDKLGIAFVAAAALAGVAASLSHFAAVPAGAAAGGTGTASATPPAAASPAPGFARGEWVNGSSSLPGSTRGKVVLVNFWTYSCINSLRPLPYLRGWADKYRADGLVVLGVHTPEFTFEKDDANVRDAVVDLGIRYPVLLDSDYENWRRFENRGWPAFYLIDARGRIRFARTGEGHYADTEQVIRQLLAEAGHPPSGPATLAARGEGVEAEADWSDLGTGETYLGSARATDFTARWRVGDRLAPGHWGAEGHWRFATEYAALATGTGSIGLNFHARDAHMVLGNAGLPVRFRVTIDGNAPGADHGSDTDAEGYGTIVENRLYQLVRQSGRVGDRSLLIEFLDPGARAYSFTFG